MCGEVENRTEAAVRRLVARLLRHRTSRLPIAVVLPPENLDTVDASKYLFHRDDILIKGEFLAEGPSRVFIPAALGRGVFIPAEQRVRAKQE